MFLKSQILIVNIFLRLVLFPAMRYAIHSFRVFRFIVSYQILVAMNIVYATDARPQLRIGSNKRLKQITSKYRKGDFSCSIIELPFRSQRKKKKKLNH